MKTWLSLFFAAGGDFSDELQTAGFAGSLKEHVEKIGFRMYKMTLFKRIHQTTVTVIESQASATLEAAQNRLLEEVQRSIQTWRIIGDGIAF